MTTINPDGSVNCAAMGVEWGEERIVIKPYSGTRTRTAAGVEGALLDNACSWREVRVESVDESQPRARVTTVVVGGCTGREFLGFNRACHAVLEASILASRVRRLPAAEIHAELRRLQVLVDKTAGPREREAMEYVRAMIGNP